MAHNLYEPGDRAFDPSGAWLHDRQDGPATIVAGGIILVALVIAAAAILLFKDLMPAADHGAVAARPTISEQFGLCDDLTGAACVLSADSYAYKGHYYRLADISVPSQIGAKCPAEAERAQEGRIALAAMMNGGAFEARPDPIDPDPAARVPSDLDSPNGAGRSLKPSISNGIFTKRLFEFRGVAFAFPRRIDFGLVEGSIRVLE